MQIIITSTQIKFGNLLTYQWIDFQSICYTGETLEVRTNTGLLVVYKRSEFVSFTIV